jgi:acyl-CoA thioester hydrolase
MSPRRTARPGPFLEHNATVRVRFQDVDALQVVWHGHYLGYFEAGRERLGEEYGLAYQDIAATGFLAPVVHAEIQYLLPARYGDELAVIARLHHHAGALLDLTYEVRRKADGALLATGRTRQVFTDRAGRLQLEPPAFLRDFWERWRDQLQEG